MSYGWQASTSLPAKPVRHSLGNGGQFWSEPLDIRGLARNFRRAQRASRLRSGASGSPRSGCGGLGVEDPICSLTTEYPANGSFSDHNTRSVPVVLMH